MFPFCSDCQSGIVEWNSALNGTQFILTFRRSTSREADVELARFGQSYTIKARDVFHKVDNTEPASKRVQVNFHNFGRGPDRRSVFGVTLRWPDIEAALKAFSDMGHPQAIKLRNALDLANAVEEVGWQATDKSASS
jgi:hypothetical protein